MRLTITNDEGEVYVAATRVRYDRRVGRWYATDEEGDEVAVNELLEAAAKWEERNA